MTEKGSALKGGRKKFRALRLAAVFAVASLALLLGFGFLSDKSVALLDAADGVPELKLIEEYEGSVFIVLCGEEDTELFRLGENGGSIELRRQSGYTCVWAGMRGDSILLLEDRSCCGGGAVLHRLSTDDFSEKDSTALDWEMSLIGFYDFDSGGNDYYVSFFEGDTLRSDSGFESLELENQISFLEADSDGRLYYFDGTRLYTGWPWDENRVISEGVSPIALLENGGLLGGETSESGEYEIGVYKIEDDCLERQYVCSSSVYGGVLSSLSEDYGLTFWSDGVVKRLSPAGEANGSFSAEGILGLCTSGAVLIEDGQLIFRAFDTSFAPIVSVSPEPGETPTSEPTSEPTAEPTAEPVPTEEPTSEPTAEPTSEPVPTEEPADSSAVTVEEEFYVFNEPLTIEELRALFEPETVEIEDEYGGKITAGRAATGMTANGKPIVILGDCNGSGTLTEGDIVAAMTMCFESFSDSDPFARAADLNSDGAVDTHDLLLYSELLGE